MLELLLLEKRPDQPSRFGFFFELRYPLGDEDSPEDATELVAVVEINQKGDSHFDSMRISLNLNDSSESEFSRIISANEESFNVIAIHTITLLNVLYSLSPDINLTILISNLPTNFLVSFDYDIVDKGMFAEISI